MTPRSEARFSAFVRRQHERDAEARAVDWQREKHEWLAQLDDLYRDVEAYLSDFIRDGSIKLERSPEDLHEENIGPYVASKLIILIGGQIVTLRPIGTLLIGSKGRVDVEGSAGTSRLVLAAEEVTDVRLDFREDRPVFGARRASRRPAPRSRPENATWIWKIASRPPYGDLLALNRESFFQMLLEVINA